MEIMADFIFLGSKITEDGDCRHGIKRRVFLRRKAVRNLDSIKKQRRYFACKGPYIKAMIIPVVVYGRETMDGTERRLSAKELMLSNCGAGEDS